MERFFNTAGPINPADHYALDPLARWDLAEVLGHIDRKKYFLVHAPRQTGKTTCLSALRDHLNKSGRYRCVCVSAEGAQAARHDVTQAMESLLGTLALEAEDQLADPWVERNWQHMLRRYKSLNALTAVLRGWCLENPKPLVLLMDEIDALVGLSLISVLRQLRSGYPKRPQRFPQSIVLCGMRHLRDYRMELGEEGRKVLSEASPFNINSESLRLGDFSQEDVKTLYAQHTQETGQQFAAGVCERVFELTQGQPWLVNALAYDVCFRDKAGRDRSKIITADDIETAKEKLIQRRETHLDQLMAKLKQERVHRVVAPMLRGDDTVIHPRDAEYVVDLGLLKRAPNGELSFGNPIYREIIPRELSAGFQISVTPRRPAYVDQNGRLRVEWLMNEFQQFFRENSDSWLDQFHYKEAGPHLILQAFLQRVVNGGGTIHREYALGRGRTDLVVTWPVSPANQQPAACRDAINRVSTIHDKKQAIVIELKLVHAKRSVESTMNQGLEQTAQYMDTRGATEGHLVLFDRREGKSWDERIWIKHETAPDGKKITVWAM